MAARRAASSILSVLVSQEALQTSPSTRLLSLPPCHRLYPKASAQVRCPSTSLTWGYPPRRRLEHTRELFRCSEELPSPTRTCWRVSRSPSSCKGRKLRYLSRLRCSS